nr:tetratricopeptide repeat protein 5 [Quercus suber]
MFSSRIILCHHHASFNKHRSSLIAPPCSSLKLPLPSITQYFAAGVPGSFHGCLFPKGSLHLIHSSCALNWLSKIPIEITDESSPAWNKGRIHYTNATKEVVEAYETQFAKDMESFLFSRAQELVVGGLLVLFVPAVPDVMSNSDTFTGTELDILGSCLMDMAKVVKQRKSPLQRATYEYLRGKILDVFPDYWKEAEDHLSKAVKLNPSLADPWLCLGNCIWKKGDLFSAKNCFTLALSKGPDKKILCQLSMLERRMAQGKAFLPVSETTLCCSQLFLELVEENIQHAKEAITLDVKDGNSWYNLGNACLTSFFVTGAWDHSKLRQSSKAYQNALSLQRLLSFLILYQEKDDRMKSNPDLYFNCTTVSKCLENYERALSGFEAAALKDPGLNATEEVQKMVNLLDKLENMLRGHARSKRLASLSSSLAAVNLNSSYKRATIDLLLDGLNKAVAVVGKVLFFIKHDNVAPLYYLLCESNQICFILSVYGIHSDTHYQLKSIRIDFLEQVLVNGKTLSSRQAVRTSIYAQHKP